MTAPSKPKTLKTRCIAAGLAAALALGNCAIDMSIREARVTVRPAAAPTPHPKARPKALPAKERVLKRLEKDRKESKRVEKHAARAGHSPTKL